MLMTRASRLAIEALVELADMAPQKWIAAEVLSGRTTGDLPFVKQILHRLAGAGIVRSKLGRGGGYQLALNPKGLTLKTVVDTIDGRGVERCMLDSTRCDGGRRCRLEPAWHPIRDQLLLILEKENIQSITERGRGALERFDLSELDG
jgi:Rrf2 family iron-sulfur cluster assembly transcriptional regulator